MLGLWSMNAKKREDLKILLLQIRQDNETIHEEIANFASFGHLQEEQLYSLNAFEHPNFSVEDLPQFDALFVGGSSDASVLEPERYPFVLACQRLIRHCYEKSIPTLASCFGFQLAVIELGGQVILDKDNMEMGIVTVSLTDQARNDPLLKGLPSSFYAVSGHKERALSLPHDCLNFGSSEKCPFHLFSIKGKPFYGFQFHPEVNRKTLHTRLTRYAHHYLEDKAVLKKIIEESTVETPVSNALVKSFVDRIILNVC